MTRLAWHFVGDTLRDGRPIPPDGEMLIHDGKLELCVSGLRASERLIDALKYAPGNTVCRVRIGGDILLDTDKMCGSERTILWRLDAEKVLREFARWCALQVIHLWDAPEVVRQYLETGDESLRAAAWAAAWAARDAGDAAGDAWDAAWAVVWAASDALDAASAAARATARATARAAAGAAAWDAAWAAARDAWDAVREAQNGKLTEMVLAAHEAESQA